MSDRRPHPLVTLWSVAVVLWTGLIVWTIKTGGVFGGR